jgi:hypothetical protein
MLKYLIVIILFIGGNVLAQTNMTVTLSDGTTQTFSIDEISSLTFSGITDVKDFEELGEILTQFKVYQNYPNPFNPSTTIRYYLPDAGDVAVKIFNINGELVKTVKNTYQTKGSHFVTWNGLNNNGSLVASGLYIYRILFNEQMISKKMLLIK